MKNIIIMFLFLFAWNQCLASEITGTIKTFEEDVQDDVDGDSSEEIKEDYSDNTKKPESNQYIPNRVQVNDKKLFVDKNPRVKVLGIEFYKDGSLLRDSSGKIYRLSGKYKKRILNLVQLRQYAGEEIFDVRNEVLEGYEEKKFLEGDLIREIGREKVFVFLSSGKRHIKSLEELKKEHFGKEIFPVSKSEIDSFGEV